MAGLKVHKIRSFLAGVVALILAVIVISFALAMAGINVPLLNQIPAMFGVGG